jgi:hypothetical protein
MRCSLADPAPAPPDGLSIDRQSFPRTDREMRRNNIPACSAHQSARCSKRPHRSPWRMPSAQNRHEPCLLGENVPGRAIRETLPALCMVIKTTLCSFESVSGRSYPRRLTKVGHPLRCFSWDAFHQWWGSAPCPILRSCGVGSSISSYHIPLFPAPHRSFHHVPLISTPADG